MSNKTLKSEEKKSVIKPMENQSTSGRPDLKQILVKQRANGSFPIEALVRTY
jgi:hypothetical protein